MNPLAGLRWSRKGKTIGIVLIIVSILIAVFSSHYIQLALAEHISLKEFVVRTIVANQDLNASSIMYGSFFNNSWSTVNAVDVLDALDALSSIDKDAVLVFLIGPDEKGPRDFPMQNTSMYNVQPAFVITHASYVLGKIDELPEPLMNEIIETIIAHQKRAR